MDDLVATDMADTKPKVLMRKIKRSAFMDIQTQQDERFMRETLALGRRAMENGNEPFGAQ